MKPEQRCSHPQLFRSRLDQVINCKHPLCVTARQIDWESLDKAFCVFYTENTGAPAKPTRLMVGLNYLKHAFLPDNDRQTGWLRRRSSIEPVISHVKHDHRIIRNYLQGVEGDRMNALLAGCGHTPKKLLRAFFAQIRGWFMDAFLAECRQNRPEYLLAS